MLTPACCKIWLRIPLVVGLVCLSTLGFAQSKSATGPQAPAWAGPAVSPPAAKKSPVASPLSRPAGSFEMGSLYVVSALYGLGMGLWIDAEAGFKDPASFLLPPTLLTVAAPIGVRLANRPRMLRGKPAVISTGVGIGALEALAVAGMRASRSDQAWSFRASMRALMVGSTLGGVGGLMMGKTQRPSPRTSSFAIGGALWGTWVGGLTGLAFSGEKREGKDGSLGALIGLNVGLATSMGLSTLFVPTVDQLEWMWVGAGIGIVVSTPIYAFYIKDSAPPLKRGLLYTSATTALGILAGGVLGPEFGGELSGWGHSDWWSLQAIAPLLVPGGAGLTVTGSLL